MSRQGVSKLLLMKAAGYDLASAAGHHSPPARMSKGCSEEEQPSQAGRAGWSGQRQSACH